MRIGFLHRFDLTNVRILSGYPHFMAKALQDHVGEVVHLGPENSFVTAMIENAGKAINRCSKRLVGKRFSPYQHRVLSRRLGATLGARANASGCDVLFAPVASAEAAYLKSKIPIVYLSDITWDRITDYYPGNSALLDLSHSEGEHIEARVIERASALIYPSEWAAASAVEHYGAERSKVHCIPFGANFDPCDLPSRAVALNHSIEEGITLLWVGVEWSRKGGPLAHECLLELLRRGWKARLLVCGCVPPEEFNHPNIEVYPFLDKSDPAQRKLLSELFLKANFFLFPTLAEAFGIVLCEASAHGLPSLVRNTGGVGGAITEGVNGFLMDINATGIEYAGKIMETVGDLAAYDELVESSRDDFERRLNWDAWALAVKPIFERAIAETLPSPASTYARKSLRNGSELVTNASVGPSKTTLAS